MMGYTLIAPQQRQTNSTMDTVVRAVPLKQEATATNQLVGQKRALSACGAHLEYVQKSPADFVKESFQDNGSEVVQNSQESFLKPTEAMISAYNVELIKVFREKNVDQLRDMHNAGQTFQCCNRFGESLIHMACRRGWTDVVKFLVLEADCSLMLQDDFGRTPFHDACWTPEPNFDLVEFLMEQVPQLLSVEDIRGHTPFNYVRKEHWTVWCKFLEGRRSMLRPKKKAKLCTQVVG
jgi:hypothetical protein